MNYLQQLSEMEIALNQSKDQKDLEKIKEEMLLMVLPDTTPEEQVTLLDMKTNLQRKIRNKKF